MNENRILKLLKNPQKILLSLSYRGVFNFLSDKVYLKLMYKLNIGKKLDLKNPKTFNEKIQWLKLNDRKDIYTTMVDKYEAKKYVADLIGEEYIIPTLGVWDKFEDIDFDKLPNQFVLKCTHDSGGLVICRDKSSLDIEAAKKKINKCLKRNYYKVGREWPYKNVRPRIIAETFIEDEKNLVPEDYKIYCFNGKPKYIVVFHDRFNDANILSETVYDLNWNPQGVSFDNHFQPSSIVEPKPRKLEELIKICSKICKDFAQVRVDFYIVNNNIYFGEITLSTASGFQPMIPESLDFKLGEMVDLNYIEKR